jgi:hypothetical protein
MDYIHDTDIEYKDHPFVSNKDLLFGKPAPLKFLRKKFPFKIDSKKFLAWLRAEEQEITGNYSVDVSSMCEYACLYVGMLFHDSPHQFNMYYGKFGFFEHFWLGYVHEGKEYFVDLTLAQFTKAPRLAITKAVNNRVSGSYSYLSEPTPLKDYVIAQRAFEFYADPVTLVRPRKFQDAVEFLQGKMHNLNGNELNFKL